MKPLRIRSILHTLTLLLLLSAGAYSADYYVRPSGNALNPGTKTRPFKTLQRAANILKPGDCCYVGAGTYRETVRISQSGLKGRPIRFIADGEGRVILDGSDVLDLDWSIHKGNIYKAQCPKNVVQLFADGKMLVEARWPNMKFPGQLWSKDKWATSGPGSKHGTMVDADLAKTNIDWTGATAVLNVAHQFFTWTRTVNSHRAGGDTFTYKADLSDFSWRKGKHWETNEVWEDDCYILFGKLEALDSPGEWFYDRDEQMLYLWPAESGDPSNHTIKAKQRNFAFEIDDADCIEIDGFHLFAASFNLKDCNRCIVENCRLLYPCYGRRAKESGEGDENTSATVTGDNNIIRNSSFAYGSQTGLYVKGGGNIIENNIIHDFSWLVSLEHVALRVVNGSDSLTSKGNIVRRNTVFNCGSPVLQFKGPNNIVEYNHVRDGLLGRSGGSKDGSLVYTISPECAGSVIRYNWVHGALPPIDQSAPWGGGIGIRGDDRTRGLTVHHNVVFKCGGAGIIVKGDYNNVYNNTVFDIGRAGNPVGNYIQLAAGPEPIKPHHSGLEDYAPVERENTNSTIFNNAAITLTGGWKGDEFPEGENVSNNYRDKQLGLRDIERMDFRPGADSRLVDAGKIIPGITDGFKGKAPDIGAYEFTGAFWKAGANWAEDDKFWSLD